MGSYTWRVTFRPFRFLWTVGLVVFIGLTAPWYATVAAVLLAVEFEGS